MDELLSYVEFKEKRMFEKCKQISATLICVLSCFLLIACGSSDDDDNKYTLEAVTGGNGSGRIVSSPTGINCGEDCSASFDENTEITLEARSDEGSEFTGWEGDCTGTGVCTVTIDQARTVTAIFGIAGSDNTLEVGTSGNGSGRIVSSPTGINCGEDCSASFDENTEITLEAMSDNGSEFIGWGGDCTGTGDCTVTVSQARTVTGNFRIVRLEDAVGLQALTGHLQNFADIADEQGDRAAGKAGYDASVSYIQTILAETDLTVSTQEVAFRLFEEISDPVLEQTLPNQETYVADFLTMSYSGAGDVTAEIVFIDPLIPAGPDPDTATAACEAADFDGTDVSGKIAVIQRGACEFYTKARNAQDNGAVAVIIFNEGQEGRTDSVVGNLGDDSDITIPVIGLSYASAQALHTLTRDSAVTLHLAVSTNDVQATASNLFAETSGGNADQVVMLGAQLDSAIGSPGINSAGTGSAALLEIAYQIGTQGYAFANKLRFAWWVGRDQLLGSAYYTENLSDDDAASLGVYLNVDAIGSKNHISGVEDGDLSDTGYDIDSITDDPGDLPAGTGEIETAFVSYFGSGGYETTPRVMSGESDYYPFIFIGVPFGGLFTGTDGIKTEAEAAIYGGTAGEPYDACYGNACDNMDNISQDIFLVNAQAVASVAETFANTDALFAAGTAKRSRTTPSEQISTYDRFHKNRNLRPLK